MAPSWRVTHTMYSQDCSRAHTPYSSTMEHTKSAACLFRTVWIFGTLAPAVSLMPSLCPARVGWWGPGGSTRGYCFKKPDIPNLSENSVSLGLFVRGKGSDFNGKNYSENARE